MRSKRKAKMAKAKKKRPKGKKKPAGKAAKKKKTTGGAVKKTARKVVKRSPAKKAAKKKPAAKGKAKPKAKPKVKAKPKAKAPLKAKPKARAPLKAKPKARVKARSAGRARAAVKKSAAAKPGPAAKGVKVTVLKETPTRKKAGLSREDLDYFKRVLNEKRSRIVEKARDTLNEGMKLDEADLPDEYDMASSEYLQYFTLRLRGRERYFLDKIERALQRIDEGNFGICESCGEEIGMARLMARPETTLCIRCKETQEREERQFSE
jgi:DnaK suppressor protein